MHGRPASFVAIVVILNKVLFEGGKNAASTTSEKRNESPPTKSREIGSGGN
jgi:hypothetical protein